MSNFAELTSDEMLCIDGGRDGFSYVCEAATIGGVYAGVTVLTGGNAFCGAVAAYAAQTYFESQPAY